MQVIFTAIPVWSALIAFLVLGEQPLQLQGLVGAVLVIAAGISIATESKK